MCNPHYHAHLLTSTSVLAWPLAETQGGLWLTVSLLNERLSIPLIDNDTEQAAICLEY